MTTMYSATYHALQAITQTFTMAWALDAGLYRLRESAIEFFDKNPKASNTDANAELHIPNSIHGLDLKKIASDLSWEQGEQYIAEILLIYGMSIFDTWVDSIVKAVFKDETDEMKNDIKKSTKAGDFTVLDPIIETSAKSSFAGFFHYSKPRQDSRLKNLQNMYTYFKKCRNCITHHDHIFSKEAEDAYLKIRSLKSTDIGTSKLPQIAPTKNKKPLTLYLHGVVGCFDILIKIMTHYDIVLSELDGIEQELIKRCDTLSKVQFPQNHGKRNRSLRRYFESVNICPPLSAHTDDIYDFLHNNGVI